MANEDHVAMLRQGVAVWNAWRQARPDVRPNLSNANLRQAKLNKAHLMQAELMEADLRQAHLIQADLRQANLSGAVLSAANLSHADLREADLCEAELNEAELNEAYLRGAHLNGANLRDADLIGAALIGADLIGADLSEANLNGANLSGAHLSGAHLRFMDLGEAHLSGADLVGAHLSEADLIGADLIGADLSEVNLNGADLNGANLSNANLRNANLSNANLSNANLSDADLYIAIVGYTTFGHVDFSTVNRLDTVRHLSPSTLGTNTLDLSKGNIPEAFLRGCGLSDALIEYLPSLIDAMQPIQFYSCFISYSSKDEEFVRRLHERMQREKLRVWFAPEDMKGGQKFHEQIEEAIRAYDKIVVILSGNSLQSKWVMDELRRARKAELRDKRRKLFPLRLLPIDDLHNWECIDRDTEQDIADEVRAYHIPDFSGWQQHDAFEQAFARLLRDLKAVDEPPVPAPPPNVEAKKRKLRILEEQLAKQGNYTPAHVIMEIEDLRQAIAEATLAADPKIEQAPKEPRTGGH